MSIFDKVFENNSLKQINSINELYNSLDAKNSHAVLRTIQKECIDLIDNNLDSKELILKLSTGSGKTAIGLLYLRYYSQKYQEPVVFLTSNNQLVEQVILEAENLGLRAKAYGKGENVLDHDSIIGETILVATYEKLFNGNSTFQNYDINPCAIVFDDAHTGMDIIKKQFSLVGEGEIYTELVKIFQESCNNYDIVGWADLTKHAIPFEIPYWIWQDNLNLVLDLLNKYKKEFKFVYPLIKYELKFSRCILTTNKFEISPDIINIKAVKPYYETKHKLFMSATFAGSDNFVRILGLNPDTVYNILSPTTDKGIGERMILVPSLTSPTIKREDIINLCCEYSKKYSVFVLTSSFNESNDWVQEGAILLDSNNIEEELEELKLNRKGLYVTAQRFEGLDLADDLCRVLVIDGIPHGERIIEHYDAEKLGNVAGMGNKNIFRIEQGMGRAVRSPVDYAVVLLIGNDLSSFVARKECKNALSAETNCQLDLGNRLSRAISNEQNDILSDLRNTMNGCLQRDPRWKSGYQQEMKSLNKEKLTLSRDELNLAKEERIFYEKSYKNQPLENQEKFNTEINKLPDSKAKGKFFENLARIIHSHNPVLAQEIQNKAKDLYTGALTPVTLLPKKSSSPVVQSSQNIAQLVAGYSNFNGILLALQELKNNFGFNDPDSRKIEESYRKLGEFLGAKATTPDKDSRVGPDVCWEIDNNVIVLEVKHNKTSSLHKSEAGQLSTSYNWIESQYPSGIEIFPVTMTNVRLYDSDAIYMPNTLLLTQENTFKILDALILFYQGITSKHEISPVEINTKLKQYELNFTFVLKKYFLDFHSYMKKK